MTTVDMNITIKFGKKVKSIRLKKGMSQGDVARKLGVSANYISQIERGVENLSLKGIEKLAKTIDVSTSELLK
jgi:transcriptional regulator with XRE-family HTH domain